MLADTGDETTSPFTCAKDHTTKDYENSNFRFPQDEPEGSPTQKLLHYTMTFQIFVFMQLFNQINARLLGEDEFNVFAGIFKNKYFVAVALITFVVQMLMV
jgi:magnesium-transporting ATPase (P-type)